MLFSDSLYKWLKFLAQIALPGIGTFYFTIAQIWHLPAPEQVGGTILAIDTLLGLLLGLSTVQYNKNGQWDGKYDGEFLLVPTPDGTSTLQLKSVDVNALQTQDRVTLKLTDVKQ